MYPIIGRYGPFFLYSYTVVMAVGLAAGIGLTAWLERRDGDHRPGWIDGLIVASLAGLVGGRAGFVVANWTYFSEEPGQIGLVWQGGLSYHGALLVGLLGLLVWTAWRGQVLAQYAGLLAPALVLVSAFGWLACWFEGCAFGRETTFGPLAADLPDSYGVFGLRYQTQLLGLALCLLLFPVTLAIRGRLRPGLLFGLTLILLSAGRLVVTLFRGDEIGMLGPVRWDTVLDGALVVLVLLALAITTIWRFIVDK
ncbi:MAG: prolipoprotein diacylglyceryl transferase [Chloroflexota bacterium]|nr:MAG: prolipoprotein diacylglyceryl transferase [Chloroflexota bacterium]